MKQIQSAEREIMKTANEVLTVADDARLEGRASAIDPERVVDAAGTLRRIAFRVASVSDVRLQTPTPPLVPETQAARDAFEAELRARLRSWLDYVEQNRTPTSRTAMAWAARRDSARLSELLTRYTDRISASGYAEVASSAVRRPNRAIRGNRVLPSIGRAGRRTRRQPLARAAAT